MPDKAILQLRGERFGDLVNALAGTEGIMMRRVTYATDLTCWIKLNCGAKQFTVRYACDSGDMDVWQGYCFLRIWHYTRLDELDDVSATAKWIADWNKGE